MLLEFLNVSGIILLAFLAGLLAHIIYLYWQGGMLVQLGEVNQLRRKLVKAQEQETQLLQQHTDLQHRYVQLQGESERYTKQINESEQQISIAIQKIVMSQNFLHDLAHSVEAIINQLNELEEIHIEDVGQQKAVQDIRTRLRHKIDIVGDDIGDMKSFMEGYGQDIPVKRSRCKLRQLCEEVRDTRYESAVLQQIELTVDAPQNLPTVIVDRDHIRRVLTNLVDNGLKYANHQATQRNNQKPYVRIKVALEEVKHDALVVTVHDNGIGMAPELVDAFNHGVPLAKDQQKLQIQGSGLGLEIVKHYINAHKKVGINAQISATSVVGKGSIFTIRLPLEKTT